MSSNTLRQTVFPDSRFRLQTATTACPPRKKAPLRMKRGKTILNFRAQTCASAASIPGTGASVSIPCRFLFSRSQTVSLLQQTATKTGIFHPARTGCSLRHADHKISHSRCEQARRNRKNMYTSFCPANVPFRKNGNTASGYGSPHFFPSIRWPSEPRRKRFCKKRFINGMISLSVEIPV